MLDQTLVRRLREEVADVLARQRREDAASGLPPMSAEDERQFARAVIAQILEEYARAEINLNAFVLRFRIYQNRGAKNSSRKRGKGEGAVTFLS